MSPRYLRAVDVALTLLLLAFTLPLCAFLSLIPRRYRDRQR